MSTVKRGKLEASIVLSKSTCYAMRTGRCSLDIVEDHYLSPSTRINANDLLYCPRLYHAMKGNEKSKPLTVIPCECGHAEVISGHQRACIAGRKQLVMTVQMAEEGSYKSQCTLCAGEQLTFEQEDTGTRVVTLKARIRSDE